MTPQTERVSSCFVPGACFENTTCPQIPQVTTEPDTPAVDSARRVGVCASQQSAKGSDSPRRLGVGFAHNRGKFSVVSFQWSAISRQPDNRVSPTPTGSHSTAQGRDALVAHPGEKCRDETYPERVPHGVGAGPETMCNPFRVVSLGGLHPGCATCGRDPGL